MLTETAIKKENKMSIKKLAKKLSFDILLTAITVIALCVFVYCFLLYIKAEKIGGGIGTSAGRTAGRFIGSYEGITEGLAEGAKEGKADGLSAKDTEVNIANKIQTMGNLEVLSASVVLHDLQEISDKYKTLLAFYGDITFTVDLFHAEITPNGNSYEVILPMPEATLRIDDKKSEQLDSYMKHSWTGSNEDGYTEEMNSIKEITSNAKETVTNYEFLMDSAKSSAENQIKFLIQSATKEEVNVHVSFKDSNTEEQR